jgi:hypothetical protein
MSKFERDCVVYLELGHLVELGHLLGPTTSEAKWEGFPSSSNNRVPTQGTFTLSLCGGTTRAMHGTAMIGIEPIEK